MQNSVKHLILAQLTALICLSPVSAQKTAGPEQGRSGQETGPGQITEGMTAEKTEQKRELIMQEPQLGIVDENEPDQKKYDASPLRSDKFMMLSGGIEEHNLAVEWNDWHNKFADAVRSRVFSSIFETINMKPGAVTWYRCEVSADKHIKNVRITRSSGDFWYDSAIVKAVYKLDGSPILAFPEKSRRSEIVTEIGIKLGGQDRGKLDFGDVEYREIEAGETLEDKSKQSQDLATGNKHRKHKRH